MEFRRFLRNPYLQGLSKEYLNKYNTNHNSYKNTMSRFSEKGYLVKENAPIYLTSDMDRTAKWFEDTLGWYANVFWTAGTTIDFFYAS